MKSLLCLLALGLCGMTAYAGFPWYFAPPPPYCPTCPCPPGSGGTGGSSAPGGNRGGGCSSCGAGGGALGVTGGMPDWNVNEPNIDLRLHDEPLAYQSSVSRVSFQIDYWQRDDRVPAANVFTLGPGWECSWQAYIATDGTTNNPVTLYGASGGEIRFTNLDGTGPNYYYNLRLQSLTDTNGNLAGFDVFYPSGAKDVYGFLVTNSYGTVTQAYLSRKIDPYGRPTTFIYAPTNTMVRLDYVVDPDGRTNTLSYTNAAGYNCLISQVQDPFGHTASFVYDTNGYLTSVTDVAGLSSSFGYGNFQILDYWNYFWIDGTYGTTSNYWLNQLTTPYGTTGFTFTDDNLSPSSLGGYDIVDRSVVVTEPNGSHQMFVYRGYSSFASNNVDWSQVPTNTPDGSLLDDGAYMVYRNSFHWGRQQFANLSATFLATGTTNWDLTQLTPNDYLRGRWQHWLHSNGGGQSDALSMEQDPSPDGSMPGAMTWFTYPGQPPGGVYDIYGNQVSYYQGTSASPTLTIKVLPDGSQLYERYQVDEWGNRTNVISTWSSGGSVLTRTNSYIYSSDGVDLLLTIGADGVTTAAYGYDSQHQILFLTNALGEVTRFTYNTNEQPTSIKLPGGLVTTNIYGSDGFLASQIEVGFATNRYTYSNNLVYSHTDARGLTVTNSWDALQRLMKVSYPDGTAVAYTYNKLDLATVVDRLGFTNAYGYNAIRQKVFETNALGSVTSYDYCECGALENVIDALGNTNTFSHDNQGNLISVAYPDGYGITNQYNLIRQLTQRADSSGAVLNYTFNNQGLVTAISNAVGQIAAYTFDIDDRPTNTVDANGVSVCTAYDNLGRLLTRSYPDGGVEGFGYTPNVADLTRYTNQNGSVTLLGYDALNRKTNEVSVGVTTNQFTYNGAGDLLTLTDGLNHTTTFQFNQYGWLTNKIDGLNRTAFRYAYNANGWVTNRWTSEMGDTFYSHDDAGNTTQIRYPQQTNSFAYDALNRLTNMVDALGTTHFDRNAVGQLLSAGGLWSGDTVSYSYTNRLRASLSVGSSWSQSYGFDLARRLTGISSPAGTFGYVLGGTSVASSLIQQINLSNGATITNSYDTLARLTQTALNDHWGHTLDGYAYGVDARGLRTNIVRNLGLTSSTVTAGFDDIGQLTSWSAADTGGDLRQNEQLGFAYDAAGNLHLRTNGALVQTFTVDAANALTNIIRTGVFTLAGATPAPATSVTVNGQAAQTYGDFTFARTNLSLANGNNTFTNIAQNVYGLKTTNILMVNLPANVNLSFDANGSLTNDGVRAFEYDAENQVTNVMVAGNWKSEFVYDGMRRRRIERDYSWNGSVWIKTNETRLICDGYLPIQERDSNNVPLVTYTRGLDLSRTLNGAGGIGGLLARTDTNGSAFYHADGNGNITALMDAWENIVGRYLYGPFGKLTGMWGNLAPANVMRFSSKPYCQLADDYDFGFRRYRPDLQRWLNHDPLGEAGGINLYAFVNNSPIAFYDPLGLAYVCDRPLQNRAGGLVSPFIGKGYPGVHRQIFFEDYEKQKADPKKYPSNLGLFDDDKVKPDPTEKEKPKLFKQYEKKAGGFDDGIMREAIDNVAKKNGTDWKAKRNCQDFVDEALEEYFKLQKERKKQQPPTPPQPIPKAP